MDLERLTILLDLYFDQLLTPDERAELGTMLRTSARARDEFWDMAHVHALLRQWGESETGREEDSGRALHVLPPPARALRPRRMVSFPAAILIPISAAAAVIFALSLIPLSFRVPERRPVAESAEPALETGNAGVAVLARSAGAVWQDSSNQWQVGQVLKSGWLRLKAGAVQIEFSRGARVVIEGPAELELVNSNEAYLRTGKLRAHVPEPAHGFKVRTPEFDVVDLGTEFGCDLAQTGAGEVHVFTGLVSLRAPGVAERDLRANEAVRFASGSMQKITARRGLFLSDEELGRRELATTTDRLSIWKRAREALSTRPGSLIHLDFEGDSGWERTITNRVPGSATHGASIVGCNSVEGRWRGKGAVEFKRADDRLLLTVPGSFESLTLISWVRVDSLPHSQQSLLMSEGRKPGEIHWYVLREGRLGLGIRTGLDDTNTGWAALHSTPVFTPAMMGSWAMVASVFDGRTRTARHYFNGRPVGEQKLDIKTPLKFGTFEIGNWAGRAANSPGTAVKPRERQRNLDGRMDEVAILSQALDSAEILRLFEEGNPGESAQMTATAPAAANIR